MQQKPTTNHIPYYLTPTKQTTHEKEKNDLRIATKIHRKPQLTYIQEPKMCLMHFVACTTVNDYNRESTKSKTILFRRNKTASKGT